MNYIWNMYTGWYTYTRIHVFVQFLKIFFFTISFFFLLVFKDSIYNTEVNWFIIKTQFLYEKFKLNK